MPADSEILDRADNLHPFLQCKETWENLIVPDEKLHLTYS